MLGEEDRQRLERELSQLRAECNRLGEEQFNLRLGFVVVSVVVLLAPEFTAVGVAAFSAVCALALFRGGRFRSVQRMRQVKPSNSSLQPTGAGTPSSERESR